MIGSHLKHASHIGPKSFTGEDVCELHVHGSKAVIQGVFTALSKLKNFRPAEPGMFSEDFALLLFGDHVL